MTDKAKLILSMDGLVLKEIQLSKERMTIGRKAHNDIQIDNLAISGEHAVIVTMLNDSFLEDLGSTNGTFVNGQSVKKHFLQNGDTIELGKYRLKYINEVAHQAPAADFEKTMIMRPGMMGKAAEHPAPKGAGDTQVGMAEAHPPTAPAVASAAAAAAAATVVPVAQPSLPLGSIQVLSGANAGKELELTKTLTTLGKPGVQVAVIARRPQGYFITHVEGANFPIVDGKAIGVEAHKLQDNDVVELAGVKMQFFIKT
ncbi:FHA domain-containing protein [Sulfurisoma sediminicola]|uniref:FHA domain-containing protein n=1 Tax=Sulfurisoma sediminicola TaxID=1381557 RepID=A0A497XAU7_9PROT|nr:FHA domain-containing protein [Sulfurisoma sediminicola]RLJ63685.1 FHA domain-containing protein [Sulfurisoma sediminicola]